MWKSVTVPNPPSRRSAELWKPHNYQRRATEFLLTNGAAALFADPGTGKTSTVLNAFTELQTLGVAKTMLVVAPRRVCQLVWWQESQRWSQFKHLTFAWLHDSRAPWDIEGSPRRKEAECKNQADIYLINPEGVAWLAKEFHGRRMPFDVVCVDELTKFKNHMAKRSKQLRKLSAHTRRIWGLTGSPTPNGYEDLFGQILLLDGGAALGHRYTMFRDKYFVPDGFTGFKFKLAPGADKRIEDKIAPLVMRIAAEDWLDLPEKIDDPILIDLDKPHRAAYDKLRKEMLLQVPGGLVTAANSAALYSKLAQLANGQVYLEEVYGEARKSVHVHDAKLDALTDLVDSLGGAQLLVAYEFNHDLDRLKAWHEAQFGTPLRFLGKGTSDREASDIERDWNAQQIGVLAVHPASSGHGLNFQRGGAQHICWFSATWDFELYDQLIQRILRQGNTAKHVVNHLLLVKDSIDELKYAALQDKDLTQDRFLQAINTAFQGETRSPAAGVSAAEQKETEDMAFEKLKRKAEAVAAEPAAAPAAKSVPKGWAKPAAATTPDETEQRAAIREQITGAARAPVEVEEEGGEEAPVDAKAAFSPAVKAALEGSSDDEENDAPAVKAPVKKTRAAKSGVVEVAEASVFRNLEVTVEVATDADGAPMPKVIARAFVGGEFEEDAAVRMAEVAVAAAEAAFNRIVE